MSAGLKSRRARFDSVGRHHGDRRIRGSLLDCESSMVPLRVRPVTPSLALWRSGFSASPSEGEGHRFESDQGFQIGRRSSVVEHFTGNEATRVRFPAPAPGERGSRQSVGLLSRRVGVQVSSLAPNAPLAQRREERLPYKQKVPSSQLGRGTRFGDVVITGAHLPCKQEVGVRLSSSPPDWAGVFQR